MEFEAELWEASAVASWVFVTVPPDVTEAVRQDAAELGEPTAFGSVRVEARIGGTTWRTSVFPDAELGCFVLPVKKAVRRAEGLDVGDLAAVSLSVVDER